MYKISAASRGIRAPPPAAGRKPSEKTIVETQRNRPADKTLRRQFGNIRFFLKFKEDTDRKNHRSESTAQHLQQMTTSNALRPESGSRGSGDGKTAGDEIFRPRRIRTGEVT